MRILIAIAAMLISSCAALDSIGTDTSRTDAQKVTFAVESMPYDELAIKCAQWANAVACTTDSIYVQGNPKRTVLTMTVQYLNWADLGDKCGRFTGNGSCMDNGILFTSSRYNDVAGIGDLIDEAFNLGLDFNRRAQLGHELHAHILGNESVHNWKES